MPMPKQGHALAQSSFATGHLFHPGKVKGQQVGFAGFQHSSPVLGAHLPSQHGLFQFLLLVWGIGWYHSYGLIIGGI